jgi:predicted kinase
MPKVLILKGLPASGKSTFARELVSKRGYVRVNKDDLRAMLHNGKHSKGNERQVIELRDEFIRRSLAVGRNVVVDDTNFNPVHQEQIAKIAGEFGAQLTVEFVDTPLDECIRRDLLRPTSVGERVIRQMYNQYLKLAPAVYVPPAGKPRAILCDIDGTLAHMYERSPYDWHKVGTDNPDKAVIDLLRHYDDKAVILMSGRDSICRPETVDWLMANRVPFHHLYMRAEGDMRKDNIVKRELFDTHVRDDFQVEFVLDDRNQVVDMWRELGLKCFQVAAGDF